MLLHVVGSERAERNDLEALARRIVERRGRQLAPESAALARRVDVGVGERDVAVVATVSDEADRVASSRSP
jgi:hypothetical protein